MEYSLDLLIAISSAALAVLLLKTQVLNLLTEAGLTRQNYKQQCIPVGAGISFILGSTIGFAVLLYGRPSLLTPILVTWTISISFAMLGMFDDFAGNRDASGLLGHFKVLIYQRRLTTGALKAIFGMFLAINGSIILGSSLLEFALGPIIISLGANLINLLDLRPGRASKGFLFFSVLIYLAGFTSNAGILLPVVSALIVYLPADLGAKAMMGDTGSNFLGSVLGVVAIVSLSNAGEIVATVFLVLIHIYAEKSSLSRAFERIPFLRLLDMLGRS